MDATTDSVEPKGQQARMGSQVVSVGLPAPTAVFTLPGAMFEVYTAKWLKDPHWLNPLFQGLVKHARETYFRYGELSLFDDYDEKAAIYLVRVRYDLQGSLVEEWFSARFIPGDGVPYGSEDLELFTCNKKPVIAEIGNLLGHEKGDVSRIVVSSRVCGIMPYVLSGQVEGKLHQKYTALSYALVNKVFFQECTSREIGFAFLEGVVRSEFIDHALTVRFLPVPRFPCFTPAWKVFALSGANSVTLDRHALGNYAYRFPSYFLDRRTLLNSLRKLVVIGKMAPFTLSFYLEDPSFVERLLSGKEDRPQRIKNLGKLLSHEGSLQGSPMTGEELRDVLDREVEDGPELKLTAVEDWLESIELMTEGVIPIA